MKKRVFKKKKTIKVCRIRKRIGRVLSLSAAVCLLAGMALTVQGKETDSQEVKVVITEIYHKHMGNPKEEGGCYSVPVVHQHQGNEQNGGPCYQKTILHTHKGNADEGSGCYTQPVYHQHKGDDVQGGECYAEIKHTHGNECYQQEDCVMYHTLQGEVLNTWTDVCYRHNETTFGQSRGIASHSSCGKGQEEKLYSYCLACGSVSPSVHSYQKLICPIAEGTVTGYQLSCGKDEKTIDGYKAGCGMEESEREAFALSCEKSVDGYGVGCGMEEHQLCGRLIVTNETVQPAEQAVLSVKVEDLTGGKLKSGTPPYKWKNANGQLIGTGDRITVNANGTYTVFAQLENKDVDEAGLSSSIRVDNICKTQSSAAPSPTAEAESKASPKATPEATPEASPKATPEASPKATPEASPKATPEASPEPAPETTPQATPASAEDSSSSKADKNDSEERGDISAGPEAGIVLENENNADHAEDGSQEALSAGKTARQPETSLSPSPTKSPVRKESRTVLMPEKKAQKEITYTAEQKERQAGLFITPAVRIIAVAGSVLLITAGLFLLLFYLRHSVKIFNDDGEGKLIFLGRCIIKREGECYTVTITEAMVEKSCTNRYCIRPGIFLLGKRKEQELVVYQGTKGVTVYLDREIIVVI